MPDQPKPRGFATMTPERRREIARLGGKAAQKTGRCHRYTSEEAAAAGRKGGRKVAEMGTGHKFTSRTGAAAGRKAHRRGGAHSA